MRFWLKLTLTKKSKLKLSNLPSQRSRLNYFMLPSGRFWFIGSLILMFSLFSWGSHSIYFLHFLLRSFIIFPKFRCLVYLYLAFDFFNLQFSDFNFKLTSTFCRAPKLVKKIVNDMWREKKIGNNLRVQKNTKLEERSMI